MRTPYAARPSGDQHDEMTDEELATIGKERLEVADVAKKEQIIA